MAKTCLNIENIGDDKTKMNWSPPFAFSKKVKKTILKFRILKNKTNKPYREEQFFRRINDKFVVQIIASNGILHYTRQAVCFSYDAVIHHVVLQAWVIHDVGTHGLIPLSLKH